MGWSAADIPSLDGQTIVITGANTGLGFEAAKAVAARGARTVLACRNGAKAEAAAQRIREAHPSASVEVRLVDVGRLDSVRAFAADFLQAHDRLDALVLNAGIMAVDPELGPDGLESQFVTNHLGHFLLTGLLMPRLRATPGARVVSHASLAHRQARSWGHPDSLAGYERWKVYAESKLCNLLFALELDRRFRAAGVDAAALAAHPGISATELGTEGTSWTNRFVRTFMPVVTQSAASGALPLLRATVDRSVPGGSYLGPKLLGWGAPVLETPTRYARDEALARSLWEASVRWAGVDPLPLA